MAMQTTSSGGLTNQYQLYFSKQLLPHAIDILVLDQFARKVPFPKNAGAKSIRFMRQDVGLASNVATLSEGIAISAFRDTTFTNVDVTLGQYGEAGKYSDILTYTELYDILEVQSQQFGEDAALKADDIILTSIVPNVTGTSKHYSGTTSWANLAAGTAAAGSFTVVDALDAMTRLAVNKAPKLNGGYVIVVPPQVGRDLLNDPKFVLASQYGTVKGLYNGELGTW